MASKLEEARNPFSPGAPLKDTALPAPGFLRLGHLRWTCDLHKQKIITTWVLSRCVWGRPIQMCGVGVGRTEARA